VAGTGFEPPSIFPEKTADLKDDGAKSDALSADRAILTNPDLTRLAVAWPNLPENLKVLLLKLADQSFKAR